MSQTPLTTSPRSAQEAYVHRNGYHGPVCRETPLRGRQTVCSGKCRAARWRRQRETTREARDREIRELLEAALQKLEGPCS
jgi:hypothetical protein